MGGKRKGEKWNGMKEEGKEVEVDVRGRENSGR